MRKTSPTRHLIPLAVALGTLCVLAPSASGAHTYRIIGGSPAAISSVPYTAALVTRGDSAEDGQFCGGSVIAPGAVLTAAHCVEDTPASKVDVVTGRTRLSDSGGQRTPVARVAVYPGWNSRTSSGDSAVLLLSRRVSAPAVALAGPAEAGLAGAGRSAVVAGWGVASRGGEPVDALRAVGVTIHSSSACSSAYAGEFSTAFMLCAGGSAGDSCQGDSGGPLLAAAPGGPVRQIGIVSFGGDSCADSATPGAYARVSAMANWIAQTAGGSPPATAPKPPAGAAPRARFGSITCGAATCRVEVRLARDSGVGAVVVKAKGSRGTRSARARRTATGRWVATIALPNGVVHLSAAALTPGGKHTGNTPRLTVEVSG